MPVVAGLRLTGLAAPWVLDGPMDGAAVRIDVGRVLTPTLRRGDVVVPDNLPAHKVAGIREAIAARRARVVYLSPASPAMNPIGMAFAELEALLRQGPARIIDGLVARIGPIRRRPARRMHQLLPRRRLSTLNVKMP